MYHFKAFFSRLSLLVFVCKQLDKIPVSLGHGPRAISTIRYQKNNGGLFQLGPFVDLEFGSTLAHSEWGNKNDQK